MATTIALLAPAAATADCSNGPSGGTPLGNVIWGLVDTVAACPAGDSVFTGRPSRLRIWISYSDVNCNPKVGVAPESIWANVHATTGSLKVNDEGTYIYADDSTDANGYARVTIPSFSGSGLVSIGLSVSGKFQGYKTATVRTTDTNADGRSDASDLNCSRCWADINYDGKVDGADSSLIIQHTAPKHWHRNVLYGTLVRMTNACPTCGIGTPGELGDGDLSWSPSGRMVAVSIHDVNGDCDAALLPSDPAVGSVPRFLSFPPSGVHDYSPMWSPLDNVVFWSRADNTLQWKGIPGRSADTTTYTISVNSTLAYKTDIDLSPDGTTIVFAGLPSGGTFHIYTVPVTGGAPTQLTSGSASDDYPHWAPDGSRIVFWRSSGGQNQIYEVSSSGGTPVAVTAGSANLIAAYHPDGAVFVYSKLNASNQPQIATVDSTLANAAGAVINYPAFVDGNSPAHWCKISPDGTRLMMLSPPPGASSDSRQLWIARRNMSTPPTVTAFGGQQLADSTAVISVSVVQGVNFSATVAATDAESDPLTYEAMFLRQDLGMNFDPVTKTFSWTPPSQAAGLTFNVKFLVDTPSGGTDAFLAQFSVHASAGPSHAAASLARKIRVASPDPVRDRLVFAGDFADGGATLEVYDATGRVAARVRQPGGGQIAWDLATPSGARAKPGVYFYRVSSGGRSVFGKVVVVTQ